MIDSSETQLSYAISGYQGSPEEELIEVINNTKEEDNEEVLLTVSDLDLASSMKETFNEMWDSGDLENW